MNEFLELVCFVEVQCCFHGLEGTEEQEARVKLKEEKNSQNKAGRSVAPGRWKTMREVHGLC